MCSIEITECRDEKLEEIKNWYGNIPLIDKDDLIIKFEFDKYPNSIYSLKVNNDIIGVMSVYKDNTCYSGPKRFIAKEHRSIHYGEKMLDFIINDARNEKKRLLKGVIRSSKIDGINFFKEKGFKIVPNGTTSIFILEL